MAASISSGANLLLLLGGAALLGIIPLIGDALKAIVKQALKQWLKATVSETVERLSVRLSQEEAARLAHALGEAEARQLIDALGEDVFQRLEQQLDAATLQRLTRELGPEAVRALATLLEQGVSSADAIKLLESAQQAGVLDGVITLIHTGAVQRLMIKDREDAQVIVSYIEKAVRLLLDLEPGAVQRLTQALSLDEIVAVLAKADPATLAALANRLTVDDLRALASADAATIQQRLSEGKLQTAPATVETSNIVVVLDRVSHSEARAKLRDGIKELSPGQVQQALDALSRGRDD